MCMPFLQLLKGHGAIEQSSTLRKRISITRRQKKGTHSNLTPWILGVNIGNPLAWQVLRSRPTPPIAPQHHRATQNRGQGRSASHLNGIIRMNASALWIKIDWLISLIFWSTKRIKWEKGKGTKMRCLWLQGCDCWAFKGKEIKLGKARKWKSSKT